MQPDLKQQKGRSVFVNRKNQITGLVLSVGRPYIKTFVGDMNHWEFVKRKIKVGEAI